MPNWGAMVSWHRSPLCTWFDLQEATAAPTADRNYLKQLPDVVSEPGFTTRSLVSSHLLLEFSWPQRVQGPGANPTGLAQLPGGALLFRSVATRRGSQAGSPVSKASHLPEEVRQV